MNSGGTQSSVTNNNFGRHTEFRRENVFVNVGDSASEGRVENNGIVQPATGCGTAYDHVSEPNSTVSHCIIVQKS